MAEETWGENDEVVEDSSPSLWDEAREAITSVLNPNLGMRAANPFAPGVSSQGTEAISQPMASDPRADAYAGDAAAATAINSGLASGLGIGGVLRAGLIPAAKVLGGGYLGGQAGERVGEVVGMPGVGKVVGSVAGAGIGAAVSPQTVATAMAEFGVPGVGGRVAQEVLKQAPKAAQRAAQAAEVAQAVKAPAAVAQAAAPAASAVTGGLSGAQRGAIMIREAGKAARAGQRFEGQKIWFALDDAGNPTQLITPGQASRLAESQKTWVKNMWGKGSRP